MIQNSGSLKIRQTSPTSIANEKILNDLIIDSIRDIKGQNIIKMDLSGLDDAPTNFFIICQGESNIQVRAISQNINKRVKEELGIVPDHMEGVQDGRWILVDYFDTVVHVFYPETRHFYDLEELWNDANFIHYDDLPNRDISSS